MIDLHMHTNYSDGSRTVEEILKKCEEMKLEYISITDHNTCKQYLDEALKKNIFTGTIIKGCELHAVFQNKSIEILAYDIDIDIINEWCEKYYSKEKLKEQQDICYKRLLDICDNHGLVYDETKIIKPKTVTEYIEIPIYDEVMKHKENYEILGEFIQSFSMLFRKGLSNINSSYFMNHIEFRPPYEEVINIIHKAGGKAFLAHPFQYRFEDTIVFVNDLRELKELDGIECFHSSYNETNNNILVNYANENKLYISGGSDFHGKYKPDINLGVGEENSLMLKKYINEWIEISK